MISLYQSHVARWKGCTRCDLHKTRNNVVLARGSVPCKVVFVGEAPGDSEDVVGKPFVGPAGRLLQQIIDRSLAAAVPYALTNLVGCIPRDPENWSKFGEPEDESVEACSPRLQEFVRLADPELIVRVGSQCDQWLAPGYKHTIRFHKFIPQVSIVHPAWILRQNVAQRNLFVRRCIIAIDDALSDLPKLVSQQRPGGTHEPPF